MIIARAALLFLCLLAGAAQGADQGFVWCIDDADNRVCLAGSMHLLPPEAYPLAPAFDWAYEKAEIVAFEADLEKLQSSEVQTRRFHAAQYPADTGLEDHLTPELYAEMARVLGEMGANLSSLRRFRPWVVAGLIETQAFMSQGFRPDHGVDAHFFKRAREDGKELRYLEAVSDHLDLLTEMPAEMATAYLQYNVRHAEEMTEDAQDLYALWRAGNAQGVAALIADQVAATPALYERLLYRRNQAWLDQIVALINGNKDAMVIVGALHLVGEKGLLALLRERGYSFSRAQDTQKSQASPHTQ